MQKHTQSSRTSRASFARAPLRPPRARLPLLLLALLSFGCQSSPKLSVEAPRDLPPGTTWSWQPAPTSEAPPLDVDDRALMRSVAREVAIALGRRHFSFDPEDPDLLVHLELVVTRRIQRYTQTDATRVLSSLSWSPSYHVQTSEVRQEVIEDVRLAVALRDAKTRELAWRGSFDGRFVEPFWPHAPRVVSQVLAGLEPLTPHEGHPLRVTRRSRPTSSESQRAPRDRSIGP